MSDEIMNHAKQIAANIIANQQTISAPPVPPNNEILTQILTAIEDQVPEGKVYNRAYTITDAITELYNEEPGDLNWTSFDLSNDGPNNVYFSVNDWEWAESPLTVSHVINVNLKKRGAIKRVYLIN